MYKYIGQTSRKLKNEKQAHRQNTPEKSAFAAHHLVSEHSFKNQVYLLHEEERFALERVEIMKAFP
jgi:hypothetical protein